MNRAEEYRQLLNQLEDIPPQLEHSVTRALQRVEQKKKARRLRIPAAALAGLAASFVLLVNVFPSFALACANVPLLRELTAAVAFSPSLSAAVAHDYVQYVGQSRTVDGITMTVEYLIADENQIVIFHRTSGEPEELSQPSWEQFVSCDLKAPDGTELFGYSSSSSTSQGDLKRLVIHLKELDLPTDLILDLSLRFKNMESDAQLQYDFSFPVQLDPDRTAETISLPVNSWVELDGQRLLVDRLEITPTRTALYLNDDPDNTKWLIDLRFHFTDETGKVYNLGDGDISAYGRAESPGFYTYYHQSLYFVEDLSSLTLTIDQALWLDKEAGSIQVDLNDGSILSGTLPDCFSNLTVETSAQDRTTLYLEASIPRSPIMLEYEDASGGEHRLRGHGMRGSWTDDDGVIHPYRFDYVFEHPPGNIVELDFTYTDVKYYSTPVIVALS